MMNRRGLSRRESDFYETVAAVKKGLVDDVSEPNSAPSSPDLTTSDSSRASVASAPTPLTPSSVADSFVFAFDIDGVLVRGGEAIPEAIEAMRALNGENQYGIHV